MKKNKKTFSLATMAISIITASIMVSACTISNSPAETTASQTETTAASTTEAATTEAATTEAATTEETIAESSSSEVTGEYTTIISGPANINGDEGNELIVDNQNSDVYTGEVIIPLGEGDNAPLLLDATSGYPITASELIPDGYVYAYISDAMTMSLPPMANARIIFCNIPADYRAPEYVVAATTEISEDGNFMVVTGTNGKTYTIDAITAEIIPYLTRNIVTLDDISTDTSLIIWTGDDDHISKVVVFADDFFSGSSQSDNAR